MSCKGETFATPADTSGKIKHRFSFHPDVCLWTKTRFFSGLESCGFLEIQGWENSLPIQERLN
jgi:hypothetical protein